MLGPSPTAPGCRPDNIAGRPTQTKTPDQGEVKSAQAAENAIEAVVGHRHVVGLVGQTHEARRRRLWLGSWMPSLGKVIIRAVASAWGS